MVIVVPENDIREHETDSTTCPCNPHVDFDAESGEMMVYHNPFDDREFIPWPELLAQSKT